MSVSVDWELEPQSAGEGEVRVAPLLAVVGFDGSEASRQALRAATQLITGREGHLEVVYVAHVPTSASLSADAELEIHNGFDELEQEYDHEVEALVGRGERRWHFQRRDGAIAAELVAAAEELSGTYGHLGTVVIVVGSSVHRYHRVIGSVPVHLARQARFSLLVVPSLQGPPPAP
jgi:nucleotide-binding universal stress UspA family protein